MEKVAPYVLHLQALQMNYRLYLIKAEIVLRRPKEEMLLLDALFLPNYEDTLTYQPHRKNNPKRQASFNKKGLTALKPACCYHMVTKPLATKS